MSQPIFVCFAVKEEGRFFKSQAESTRPIQTLITGMGRSNAEKAIRSLLAKEEPGLVLSCGFAGGLKPDLAFGSVVFDVETRTGLESSLLAAGAQPARFHCADRVAATADQKRSLYHTTRADAVEMESQVICNVCRGKNVPSGTVRVILDTAGEDLPLDFNLIMTADQRMDYRKLAMFLIKSPAKIKGLLRLSRGSQEAAKRLADVLNKVFQ